MRKSRSILLVSALCAWLALSLVSWSAGETPAQRSGIAPAPVDIAPEPSNTPRFAPIAAVPEHQPRAEADELARASFGAMRGALGGAGIGEERSTEPDASVPLHSDPQLAAFMAEELAQ